MHDKQQAINHTQETASNKPLYPGIRSAAAYGLGVFPLDVSLDAQRCVYDPQVRPVKYE